MISHGNRRFLELLDLLYSCADGDGSWSVFLNALSEQLGASVIGITTNSSLQAVVNVDPAELVRYQKYYLGVNPWLADPQAYPEGQILLTEEVLPVSSYRKTAFYNEWGRKNLVSHSVGGAIRVSQKSFLFLSINRGDAQGPFGEREREFVQLLMPHIQRAANLHDRVQAFERTGWVLDSLALPMMYVDANRAVRWANPAAQDLLRAGRGLLLRDERLRAQLKTEDAALQKMLGEGRATNDRQNVSGFGGWLRVTRSDDGSTLSLFLTRPPRKVQRSIGLEQGDSGFLIFIAIQAIDSNLLATRIRKTWGLTTAESALAVELLESDTLQMAAAKLRISRNTAKSQLSAIFQKSGSRRQSDLVRRLLAFQQIPASPSEK